MHHKNKRIAGDKVNRETRRRLKQSQTNKTPVNSGVNINKALEHHRIKEALDEGIMLGFHTARLMIYNTAKKVKGVGDKRAKEISRLFDEKIEELSKIKEGEVE